MLKQKNRRQRNDCLASFAHAAATAARHSRKRRRRAYVAGRRSARATHRRTPFAERIDAAQPTYATRSINSASGGGAFNGPVDISGWQVMLDPDDGPIFAPQTLSLEGQWHNLGSGPREGAINAPVLTIALSGTEVLVGGFTNAGGVTGANYLGIPVGGADALNGWVLTIALSGTEVLVGGNFKDAGRNKFADYIARYRVFRRYLPLVTRDRVVVRGGRARAPRLHSGS